MGIAQRLGTLVLAALIASHGEALAQTIRVPAPAQGVAPIEQPPVQARVPLPLERNSNALAKLGLRPTDLQLGRSISYSATHLYDRSGELTASGVNVVKSSDGYWVLERTPGASTDVNFGFRTQPGQSYVVTFAIVSPRRGLSVIWTVNGVRHYAGSISMIDGLLTIPVTGDGARHRFRVSAGSERFVFYHVTVTPQVPPRK